ncbi:hypothetical protein B5C26_17955 [Photorhabdus luminescens]|uniref:hypothetical protein n=1 Tax=Photorhabdus luminescens TaxID=29488 RepID=UPI000B4DB3EC|nr:hypothetical protein [Photorhabdus luminescens]OWO80662.1 hypothetical protein B5C26_17955 [Photorhabdus luminescens]
MNFDKLSPESQEQARLALITILAQMVPDGLSDLDAVFIGEAVAAAFTAMERYSSVSDECKDEGGNCDREAFLEAVNTPHPNGKWGGFIEQEKKRQELMLRVAKECESSQ